MKKRYTNRIVFLLNMVFFLALCVYSRGANSENGLLWRISGNGLKEPSYLFGTNHGMHRDFLDRIPGFFEILDSVKQLAVESDITKRKELDAANLASMVLPQDTSYADLLERNELEVLDSFLTICSTLNAQTMKLNPNFLLKNLQVCILKRESEKWAKENRFLLITPPPGNVESRLLRIAKFRSFSIVELDTEEELERMGLQDWSLHFASNDLQQKAKEMIGYLLESQRDSQLIVARSAMEAYYLQDLQLIHKWSTHPSTLKDKKAREFQYVAVTLRSKIWMEKIISTINNHPTMIAVGAAHLPGKDGLINLLREKGYRVDSA